MCPGELFKASLIFVSNTGDYSSGVTLIVLLNEASVPYSQILDKSEKFHGKFFHAN
jgi:hypothetical protein